MQEVHGKLNPGLPWQKQHSQEEDCFHQKIRFQFKRIIVKCFVSSIALFCADTWTLRKISQKYSAREVLKCGAGEGWRRLVGRIM